MVEEPVVIGIRCNVGALVRIGAQIVELRHAQRDKRLGPDPQCAGGALLHEYELPVVVTQAREIAVVREIEVLYARAFLFLARQIRQQVVAVQVNLESLIADAICPSLSFSLISGSPAIARNVGSQSMWLTISLETEPALILPGQRTIAGTR